jgi:hypothetical protein
MASIDRTEEASTLIASEQVGLYVVMVVVSRGFQIIAGLKYNFSKIYSINSNFWE